MYSLEQPLNIYLGDNRSIKATKIGTVTSGIYIVEYI